MQKNIKKYFSFIIVLLFFIIFSFSEWKEYLGFYKNYQNQEESKQVVYQNISDFNLENLREIDDVKLYHTPDKQLMNDLVNKIDWTKSRIYIEVYMLTETRLQKALVRAKERGIDIKIILEKNPYMAYSINTKAYDFLDQNWIFMQWSNPKNFSLNHAKFMILDNEVIISTWNLTYSTFAYNRDFFLFINDKQILEKLVSIFEEDFIWNLVYVYDNNLVLSPEYSRVKFEKLFLEASESIDMYFQYLKDNDLLDVLISKLTSWIKLRIILNQSAIKDNYEEIDKLESLWADIVLVKTPKIHSKAILIDEKYLFLWSINFSEYSLDKNREVWIILTNHDIIKKFKTIFKKDFLN